MSNPRSREMAVNEQRAYAVAPTPLPRKTAATPLSAQWTLYNPGRLADELGVTKKAAAQALEKTGFSKAVRIREELIRYKERLRRENADLNKQLESLAQQRRALKARQQCVMETLVNVRNCLRISREHEIRGGCDDA